jgi:hypothetical protein
MSLIKLPPLAVGLFMSIGPFLFNTHSSHGSWFLLLEMGIIYCQKLSSSLTTFRKAKTYVAAKA